MSPTMQMIQSTITDFASTVVFGFLVILLIVALFFMAMNALLILWKVWFWMVNYSVRTIRRRFAEHRI